MYGRRVALSWALLSVVVGRYIITTVITTLDCLLHSPVRKQYYGVPHLLVCCLICGQLCLLPLVLPHLCPDYEMPRPFDRQQSHPPSPGPDSWKEPDTWISSYNKGFSTLSSFVDALLCTLDKALLNVGDHSFPDDTQKSPVPGH